MIKSRDGLRKDSKNISNYIQNKNFPSHKKLFIILPIDSDKYKKKYIYKTLRAIFNLNYNYSLFLVYNKKCPKIYKKKKNIFKMEGFNNILIALNTVIDSINDNDYDYITFLTPGDFILPSTYDFLNYIEEHDIYQILEIKKSVFHEKAIFNEKNYVNTTIYDFMNIMPNNNFVINDKIYKISMLKKNNLKSIFMLLDNCYY